MARRPPPGPSMTAYRPTWRDQIGQAIAGDDPYSLRGRLAQGLMGSTGVGAEGMSVVDFTPAGVPLALQEGSREVADGHPFQGAMTLATALPLPIAKGAKAGVKALKTAGQKVVKGAEKTAPKAARGIVNTPDLRLMTQPEAAAAARKQPHLIPSKEGFIGAPQGVKTKRDVGKMRATFDKDVIAGAPGRNWYPEGREWNVQVAGPDPARQSLLAREEGLWSAQADPDPNLNFLLQAHNAYEIGKPRDIVRNSQMARTYNKARDAGVPIPLGPKTGIYADHLDPTVPHPTVGTNDIWHARAFGYKNPDGSMFDGTPSDAQHRFLDYETVLAADRASKGGYGGATDWEPHQVQAAPWVAGKGRALAERRRITEAEGIAEASKGYPGNADKFTAFSTYEAQPYVAGGHMTGLNTAGPAERAAYANDPASSWADENGRDVIHDAVGLYQRPTQRATGVYTPPGGAQETNPAFVARPLVGVTEGGVDPASREALDSAEALRSYVDVQGAGAWHKNIANAKPGEMGSVFTPHDGPLSLEQIEHLQQIGGDKGLYGVLDSGQGFTLTQFDDLPPSGVQTGKDLKGGMATQLRDISGGGEPSRVLRDGGYVPNEGLWEQGEGSGAATKALLDRLEANPTIFDKMDASPDIRAKAGAKAERDEARRAATGDQPREDVQRARRILAEGGLKGLREAFNRGEALPAALLPLVGLGTLAHPAEEDEQPY